jgi:multidrug resistance protein, MATE family
VTELRTITRHAGTVLVGQLATMAYGVADTVIAGRYSDEALAALSVGSAFYISVFVGLIGVVQALLPIWAELRGAKRSHDIGRSLRQSLYLSALITAVGITALLFPAPLLRLTSVPEGMQHEVRGYLTVLAFAFAPALLFRLFSTFNQSLGKPVLVTWLQIAGLAVKIPLSIWFVAGGAGLAPQGAVGCAWATLVVNYLLLALGLYLLATRVLYKPFRIWQKMEPPDFKQIAEFARLGIPAGLSYFVEVTSFTLMALFIARQGVSASAAHQVAASLSAVLYMVPLSLAIACSARVSFWLGAGDTAQARRVVWLGLKVAVSSAIVLAAIVFTLRDLIAGWYTASPAIQALAASLLMWVTVYHVADSTQAVSAFLLRCYRITVAPLALYGFFLWGLGLYGGYRLAYVGWPGFAALQSPSAFWMASTFALILVATCLLGLLAFTVRRKLPETSFLSKKGQ